LLRLRQKKTTLLDLILQNKKRRRNAERRSSDLTGFRKNKGPFAGILFFLSVLNPSISQGLLFLRREFR
jgi:hypothetical protein